MTATTTAVAGTGRNGEAASSDDVVTLELRQPDGGRLHFRGDGTHVELFRWDARGRCGARRWLTVTSSGEVDVIEQVGDGPRLPSAGHVERWTTPSGTSFDYTWHAGGIEVERTLTPDGQPRTVRVIGPWGEHQITWTDDGTMLVTWRLESVHGTGAIAADGRHRTEVVTFGPPGTSRPASDATPAAR